MTEHFGPNDRGKEAARTVDLDTHVRELIGKAIRVRRERAGLSREQAAERLGVSRSTMARWERGEGSLWTGGDAGTVDHVMMRRLRDCYGCEVLELAPRNQYPSAPVDPALRREWAIRRNAGIQGVDPDGAFADIEAARAERSLRAPAAGTGGNSRA